MPADASPTAELFRSAVGRVGLAAATDGDLVRRFAADRDDLAFAELVHRFAPAVYALCRRHLTDPGAADDAFQTVFVLLARKADTLTYPDRVGGWLVGTADRVARTARRRQAKRTARLRPLDTAPEPAAPDAPASELRVVLDDELAKLPSHYRQVVLLCDVGGVPRRVAAAQLGIPTGTLSNRLTRARAVLGRRLLRRGVLVASGGVMSGGTMAHPPARLLALAVRTALSDSPPVELLAIFPSEVSVMVRAKQLLAVVAGLAVLGGGVTGVILLTRGPTPPPTTNGTKNVAEAVTPTTAVRPRDPNEKPPPWVEPKFGEGIRATAFTADGKQAVMLQSHERPYPSEEGGNKLLAYDTSTWQAIHTLDFPERDVGPMAMTADGQRVFVAVSQKGVFEWRPGAKEWAKKFDLGPVRVPDREPKPKPDGTLAERLQFQGLRLTPDGKLLAASLQYVENGHLVGQGIRLWDTADGTVVRTILVRPGGDGEWYVFPGLDFTDGGRTVAVNAAIGSDKNLLVEFDVATGEEKRRTDLTAAVGTDSGQPQISSFLFSPDGKRIAVAGGIKLKDRKWAGDEGPVMDKLKAYSFGSWLIDRESGKLVKPLAEHRSHPVSAVSLSPDRAKLFVRVQLPSRMDRDHGGWNQDDVFVELQQWDVATWGLDWVKIVPATERWKLMNGAAK